MAGPTRRPVSPETRAKLRATMQGRYSGAEHPQWKGGRCVRADGYVQIWDGPGHGSYHPLEHRVVMERMLGRKLTDKEQVHHINGDRSDNREENLQRCDSAIEHKALHPRKNGAKE